LKLALFIGGEGHTLRLEIRNLIRAQGIGTLDLIELGERLASLLLGLLLICCAVGSTLTVLPVWACGLPPFAKDEAPWLQLAMGRAPATARLKLNKALDLKNRVTLPRPAKGRPLPCSPYRLSGEGESRLLVGSYFVLPPV